MTIPTRRTRPVDGIAVALMIILCALWGGQQVIIKLTVPLISAVLQVGLRSGLAALAITIFLILKGCRVSPRKLVWKPGIVAGLLFGVEYLLICIGLQYTSASRMVTFIYTAPIFAAIGLHLLHPQERLRRVQWLGIICAFIGVTISFFTHDTSTGGASSGSTLLGDTLGVVAGALWGGLTVLVRSTGLATAPPVEGLMYQLVGGCVVLTSCAPFLGAWYFTVSAISWFSLVLQTVLIAMASFFGWLWLLSRYNASELGALSFMTPVFGTMLGIALLGEPLYPSFIIGSALVFLGILLVNGSAVLSSTLTRLLHRYR